MVEPGRVRRDRPGADADRCLQRPRLQQAAAAELLQRLRPRALYQRHHPAGPLAHRRRQVAPPCRMARRLFHRPQLVGRGIEHDHRMRRLQPQPEARRLLAQRIVHLRPLRQEPAQHPALRALLGLMRGFVAEEDQRRHRRSVFDGVEVQWLQVAAAGDDPDVAVDLARHHDRRQDARHRHAVCHRLGIGVNALGRQAGAHPPDHPSAAQVVQQGRRAVPRADGRPAALVHVLLGIRRRGQHVEGDIVNLHRPLQQRAQLARHVRQRAAVQHHARQRAVDRQRLFVQLVLLIDDALGDGAHHILERHRPRQLDDREVRHVRRLAHRLRHVVEILADRHHHAC